MPPKTSARSATPASAGAFKVPNFETDPIYVSRCFLLLAIFVTATWKYWPTDPDARANYVYMQLFLNDSVTSEERVAYFDEFKYLVTLPSMSEFMRQNLQFTLNPNIEQFPKGPLNVTTTQMYGIFFSFFATRDPKIIDLICALHITDPHIRKEVAMIGYNVGFKYGHLCPNKDAVVLDFVLGKYTGDLPKVAATA